MGTAYTVVRQFEDNLNHVGTARETLSVHDNFSDARAAAIMALPGSENDGDSDDSGCEDEDEDDFADTEELDAYRSRYTHGEGGVESIYARRHQMQSKTHPKAMPQGNPSDGRQSRAKKL